MYHERELFPGDRLFELKATLGFPLEIALDRIINEERLAVNWVQFLKQARKNLWTDAQTYRVIRHSLADAEVSKEIREGICSGLEQYMPGRQIEYALALQARTTGFDSLVRHQICPVV